MLASTAPLESSFRVVENAPIKSWLKQSQLRKCLFVVNKHGCYIKDKILQNNAFFLFVLLHNFYKKFLYMKLWNRALKLCECGIGFIK